MSGFFPMPFSPRFSPIILPTLQSLFLSDEERAEIAWLEARTLRHRQFLELKRAYYLGEQIIVSLGIAIPPSLQHIRTLVGWPAKAVDPYVDRLSVDSFRVKGATDSDPDLYDMWVENHMDADQKLAYRDAFSMGPSYLTAGSPEDPGDVPVICVESPLNMAVHWDVRYARPKSALQSYFADDQRHAALYLPGQTIHLGTDDQGQWQVTDRDVHGFDWVPVVRLANRPDTLNRDGQSEIDNFVMSLTDQACRTLLNLTVASELYSVPQKYILGSTEADFQNPDGTARSTWDTYIHKVLGLERDEDGNLPEVGQFQAYDPTVYTKVVDELAAQMASHLSAPPQELGLYSEGNPPSADSVEYQLDPRNKKARGKQAGFNPGLIDIMQMGMRFQNGGVLPDKYRQISVDWEDVGVAQPASTADAITKQVAAGSVPPTSDVVLKRLGYSAVERLRLEQDRQLDPGAAELAELANSLQAKQARTDVAVAADINPQAATPSAPSNGS